MIHVEISIGDQGLSLPVTFLHLVRNHLGVGLVQAKETLDVLANCKTVTVSVDDGEVATNFVAAVRSLGLIADAKKSADQVGTYVPDHSGTR